LRWENGGVSDDVTGEPQPLAVPDVASLAARWYAKASVGAPPELAADVAELGELTARLQALAAEPGPAPEPGGPGIARRLERVTEKAELTGRLGDIMARVCADSPEEAALWRVIAGASREGADRARQAAELTGNAGIV
jgi:hypothetical protein